MIGFTDHEWEDHIDLLDGMPEWKNVYAQCLTCFTTVHPVGRYRYPSEPIDLDDGTTTTFADWQREVDLGRMGKAKRRRFHCPDCATTTQHVADRK